MHLRKEVHYACPVPGCGRPLLEWHHFDPPWKVMNHHNPDGMIALCTLCHPLADKGKWTKEQLRGFKKNPAPLGLIRSTFGWAEKSVLYRLGGNYAADSISPVLQIDGYPILWQSRSPEGRLLFSLNLHGEKGQTLLKIQENCMSVDTTSIHDLSIDTGESFLKIWLEERKPGLELKFSRLTPLELRERMEADGHEIEHPGKKEYIEPPKDNQSNNNEHVNTINKPIFARAMMRCLDSDGTVPLIDVIRAYFHDPRGRLLRVTESGIHSPGFHMSNCTSFQSSFGFYFTRL